MAIEWWHWIVAGLILTMAELALTTFFIVWFGLGALVVGLVLVVLPSLSMTTQFVMWALASISFTIAWFKIFRPNRLTSRVGTADAVLGEVGMLIQPVAPFKRGQVRFQKPILGSEVWECGSEEEIASGERVRVCKVEGRALLVEKLVK